MCTFPSGNASVFEVLNLRAYVFHLILQILPTSMSARWHNTIYVKCSHGMFIIIMVAFRWTFTEVVYGHSCDQYCHDDLFHNLVPWQNKSCHFLFDVIVDDCEIIGHLSGLNCHSCDMNDSHHNALVVSYLLCNAQWRRSCLLSWQCRHENKRYLNRCVDMTLVMFKWWRWWTRCSVRSSPAHEGVGSFQDGVTKTSNGDCRDEIVVVWRPFVDSFFVLTFRTCEDLSHFLKVTFDRHITHGKQLLIGANSVQQSIWAASVSFTRMSTNPNWSLCFQLCPREMHLL